ncbi:MAG: hypothetical protein O6951_06385 [Actinobacteria bacterium]|nr:hypothetical protein [Actinomycetota bacterium]
MEPRQKWALRFWGTVLAVASWWLALAADLGVTGGEPTLGATLMILLSLGLGVTAVLMIPIETIWIRWVVNSLVMLVPILVALNLVISWV